MTKLLFIPLLIFLGFVLLHPKIIWAEDVPSPKVISNTATASFVTSKGETIIIESAPGGNSVPGEGKGTPLNIIVKEHKNLTH